MPIELQSGREGAGSAVSSPLQPGASLQQISAEAGLVEQPPLPGNRALRPIFQGAGAGIPIELDVAVPIKKFRVRNLLALGAGQVISSRWLEGEDLPLGARGAQLAWTEFEVIDQRLAVRITRLA